MAKKIALAVAATVVVALAGLFTAASFQPDAFTVTRATDIKAAPERAQALVADLHAWEKWSPWDKLDPALKRTYSGAAAGVGSVYEWSGNSDVGKGRMTITAVEPGKRVAIKLEFMEPMPSVAEIVFSFSASGGSTRVEWTMNGKNDGIVAKTFSLVADMDKTIGADFEKGLASLKGIAEKGD